jgi:hypothetical protein
MTGRLAAGRVVAAALLLQPLLYALQHACACTASISTWQLAIAEKF